MSVNRNNKRSKQQSQNNYFAIGSEEIQREFILGKGSFGTVWKGKCRGQDVAIKILAKQDLSPEILDSFKNEVTIISLLRHPNVVQFMGACYETGNFMIVTEYLPRGDLEEMLLNKKIELSLVTRMKMARDIALGMNWLHLSTPQFVHRDLKTKNLLIDEKNRIKICDFGLSQIKLPGGTLIDEKGAKGTPLWMAPEVLLRKEITEKCDVYGFGIILWCLLTRDEPFTQFNDYETFARAIVLDHYRPPIPDDCEPSLRRLIHSCWQLDPVKRPSFSIIVEEINKIIVDVAIKDPVGNKFWKEELNGRENLPLDEFLEQFKLFLEANTSFNHPEIEKQVPPYNISDNDLRYVSEYQLHLYGGLSPETAQRAENELIRRYGYSNLSPVQIYVDDDHDLNFRCLRELLQVKLVGEGVDAAGDMVSLERFGFILSLFGPIVDPVSNRVVIFDKIRRTLYYTWFHGDIDRGVAEDRIRAQANKQGAFLIRFSSQHGDFTLSSGTSSSVQHRRITYKMNEGYIINDTKFNSLESLIKTASGFIDLSHPCSGSRFTHLFVESGIDSAYVSDFSKSGYVQGTSF